MEPVFSFSFFIFFRFISFVDDDDDDDVDDDRVTGSLMLAPLVFHLTIERLAMLDVVDSLLLVADLMVDLQ